MTQILTANIGSYPRIGESKDQQRHRRGMSHFLNKDISAHALRDVEQSVIQEVVQEQVQAGMDEITDGLIHWQDPISHLCSKMTGFKITGIKRYFDTNFYFRLPVITSKPKKKTPFLVDEFLYVRGLSTKNVRMVLPGPLTLALHTESTIKPFDKLAARIQFFTDVLADEISALVSKGASSIQIDEPSLLLYPAEFKWFEKAVTQFIKSVKPARLNLAFYFNSPLALLPQLLTLPVDSLNLDLTLDGKKIFEKLIQGNPAKDIGLGCVNARNTRMEAIDPLLNLINNWLDKATSDRCYLTPSCGLEFLPREQAFAKLKLLAKLKQELQNNTVRAESVG